MELHGCKGCGSTVVEALLELAGVSYARSIFDWDDRAAWDRLRAINPLAQVPTLVLDDGTVLTESAGIALWIAERHPDAQLLPDDPSERALVYRWMVSFATNVYGPVIVGDFPERWVDGEAAHASLKAHAMQRLKDAWLAFEARIAPAPHLLGAGMTVLDVYVAMIARWRPGRAWLAEHCPKAIAAVETTERHPVVASVWARNFG
jgi:GST-like protein